MTSGIRRGEWYELRLPRLQDGEAQMSVEEASRLAPIPRKLWDKLVRCGGVRIQGNRLLLHAFPPDQGDVAPEWEELRVVYEDDFCLVVDKTAGSPVHPNEAGQPGTLAARVAAHYESTGQHCRVRHIHRLDADTSGLVLFAKNEWAHILLDEQMRRKEIRRSYLAVVQGHITRRSGTIDAPIGRDRHHHARRRVSSGGDSAVTHFRVIEYVNTAATLVELTLETGRTHQIRVHMSHLGHPLIGDKLYGGSARFARQALHGYLLTFVHPITGEAITLESDLPKDMAALLDSLRAGGKI